MIIKTVDCQHAHAGSQFVRSLHETGFAILKHHPISHVLLQKIYADWLRFFTSDEKFDYLCDPDNRDGTQAGFHPVSKSETAVGYVTKDIKEFFHVVPGQRIPQTLQHDILQYRQQAMDFCRTLLAWVQEYSPRETLAGLTAPLPQVLSSTMSLLRILHYPPLGGSEDPRAERAAPHEDINLLTLLPVALQPGLQVRDNTGRWHDLDCIRGEMIVNTGDMLLEASRGYFPSTTHRVVNPDDAAGNVSRISIPFFGTPQADFVLSARYTAGSYLEERLRLISA